MRIYRITVAGADTDIITDRCWTAGAAGVWERDDGSWRVGVPEEASASFAAAMADLDPVDVTAAESVALPAAEVTVDSAHGPILLSVPSDVFGDGNHPTTATALAMLVEVVRPGQRVLDVGCGSGLLAIAAARAGAIVTAIDVDAAAIEATQRNAERNAVDVLVSSTPLADIEGTFDVVAANMTIGDLSPILAELRRHTAPGGILMVSGLLRDQWPAVAATLSGVAHDVRITDEWITATVTT